MIAVKVLPDPVCHLDEGTGLVGLERAFEVRDRLDLAVAQAVRVEGRQRCDACAQAHWRLCPGLEGFGAVKGEDLSRPSVGIVGVGEAGDLACAFVEERERLGVGDPLQLRVGVSLGLFLDRGQADPPVVGFCFDHADRLPIGEEDVVGRSDVRLVLTDGRAKPGLKSSAFLS